MSDMDNCKHRWADSPSDAGEGIYCTRCGDMANVSQLRKRIEELEARCRNEHQRFLEFRCMTSGCGLGHTVCRDCGGAGRKMYGSTATWRGGIGGQAFTSDICDRCWGSGFEDRPWISVREHEELDRSEALGRKQYDIMLGKYERAFERAEQLRATIEQVRGLPEKLRDVAEDVGLSGNDEDANRLAHIADELEAELNGQAIRR